MNSINYLYHTYVGYILFPLRLVTFVSSTLLTIGSISLLSSIGCNTLATNIVLNYCLLESTIFGLTIHSEGHKHIVDKPCIIISNHINICDHFVTTICLNKINSYIVSNKFNITPFNKLFNFMKCIYTEDKKGNVVNSMKERIKEGGQIFIYPDGCNPIPKGSLISPFRNGAFVPKAPILPIVIRYVPSSNTNMNWYTDTISNTPFSILKSYLQDGDMQVYVKILPIQEYKDSYKSHEDYRDDIYELMTNELSKLPDQTPDLIIGEPSTEYTMNYLLKIPLTLALISHCIGYYYGATPHYLVFIAGYFCHMYPTQNTILFDRLVVPYTIYAGLIANRFLDIPDWYIPYDHSIKCMYMIIMCITGILFWRSKLGTTYTEKEHIMKVWIPAYSMSIYGVLVYICIHLF
jgi:1-acyl-sn-glycerol-3-phosphate acyltransferase